MASIKQLGERNDNISSIISFVRRSGAVTRMELCRGILLSWACVSDLVAVLIEEGILIELEREPVKTNPSVRGKNPSYLSLNERKYFLGVDINDSGIAVSTISITGTKIRSKKWNEEIFRDENDLTLSVCEKITEMLGKREDCCGIGVAMEGARSTEGGFMYPMADGCHSIHPDIFLKERFSLPVFVRHDPECILYSVAGDCLGDCISVRVDKWIGVAAMKNRKILDFPFELSDIRYGSRKLKTILRECVSNGDYREIAEALGRSVGNLSVLLGIKRFVLAGEIAEWIKGVNEIFDAAFYEVSTSLSYEICSVTDASDGAARLAMAEFSISRKGKTIHE